VFGLQALAQKTYNVSGLSKRHTDGNISWRLRSHEAVREWQRNNVWETKL